MGHGTMTIIEAYSKLYPGILDFGVHNDIRRFKSGDRIPVRDLVFRPIHVEHSTPGAYGYIIEGPEGNIVYTGDFRRHGPMRALTEEFIAEAAKAKPKIMLCEGTRMTPDPENYYDEEQVHDKVRRIMEESNGLVFGEFSMCNIDRFHSFYRAAKATGRTMVVDTKYALILDRLREFMDIPDPRKDDGLRVYFKMAKSREFEEKDYAMFEREYLGQMITSREIQADQSKYVMITGFNKLMELVYIQPRNADYIYSSSESFLEGEDNEKQREVLDNWLKHFGIELHKAHCSGHAGKSDLEYAVRAINPEVLIPIHTRNAEEFKKIHDRVMVVSQGESIEL